MPLATRRGDRKSQDIGGAVDTAMLSIQPAHLAVVDEGESDKRRRLPGRNQQMMKQQPVVVDCNGHLPLPVGNLNNIAVPPAFIAHPLVPCTCSSAAGGRASDALRTGHDQRSCCRL
jgi:hypothetical protein